MKKPRIQAQVLFVAHKTGTATKTGKPYNFVELSDGLKSQVFSVRGNDDYSDYAEGKECVAEFEIDIMKNSYNITLIGLQ